MVCMCLYPICSRRQDMENVSENVSEKLSPNQQKMINAIKENKKITYTELSACIRILFSNKIDLTTCYTVLLYFLY